MRRIRPYLQDHELSEQQWRVLRVLDEVGPLEPTDLGERCVVLTPSLTRILAKLETRGMIRREAHETDKRKQVIHLADAGAEVIGKIAPQARKIYDELEEEFGRPQMNNLLNKLRKLAEF